MDARNGFISDIDSMGFEVFWSELTLFHVYLEHSEGICLHQSNVILSFSSFIENEIIESQNSNIEFHAIEVEESEMSLVHGNCTFIDS